MWEEHLKHEFSTKNTEETIKTMVRSFSHIARLHVLPCGAVRIFFMSFCLSLRAQ